MLFAVDLIGFLDRFLQLDGFLYLDRFLYRFLRYNVRIISELAFLVFVRFLRCRFAWRRQRAARMLLGDRPEGVNDDEEHQNAGIENGDYEVGPVHLQVVGSVDGNAVLLVVVRDVAQVFEGHVGEGREVLGHLLAELLDLFGCLQ